MKSTVFQFINTSAVVMIYNNEDAVTVIIYGVVLIEIFLQLLWTKFCKQRRINDFSLLWIIMFYGVRHPFLYILLAAHICLFRNKLRVNYVYCCLLIHMVMSWIFISNQQINLRREQNL